jgi:hypothetical protein
MNSMSQVRPRGQAMPEQVKEIQKNQPFPLNQGFSTAGLHPGNGSWQNLSGSHEDLCVEFTAMMPMMIILSYGLY